MTDTKNTVTLFGRAYSQLQNTIFQCRHVHQLHVFTSQGQEPACCAHQHLHQQSGAAVSTAEVHTTVWTPQQG